jgi:16S rRNA processing protein RimM
VALIWKVSGRTSFEDRRVLVGQVIRPHGVSGELVVEPISTNPGRFTAGQRWIAELPSGEERAVTVSSLRWLGRRLGVRFSGCHNRTEAEAYRGAALTVDQAECPALPPGEVYQFELLGCRCWDEQAGDLGIVLDVVEDGGGWLLLVARDQQTRLLIPFVAAFLKQMDLTGKLLRWNLPPGFIDTCTFKS